MKTVGGGSGGEGLKRSVEDVERALQFFRVTAGNKISDMLPGCATVVLDMVLSLSLALDEMHTPPMR